MFRIFSLLFLFSVLLGTPVVRGQSISASITIQNPSASCSIAGTQALAFGTLTRPSTGAASVTVSETTGTRTSTGGTASGASAVGQFRVEGDHVSSFAVSLTWPAQLRSGANPLAYAGKLASSSNGTTYTSLTGKPTRVTGSGGGVFTTVTSYYRIGGAISGISRTTPVGTYTASVTVSVTCS